MSQSSRVGAVSCSRSDDGVPVHLVEKGLGIEIGDEQAGGLVALYIPMF
jgi:hypothetical protein